MCYSLWRSLCPQWFHGSVWVWDRHLHALQRLCWMFRMWTRVLLSRQRDDQQDSLSSRVLLWERELCPHSLWTGLLLQPVSPSLKASGFHADSINWYKVILRGEYYCIYWFLMLLLFTGPTGPTSVTVSPVPRDATVRTAGPPRWQACVKLDTSVTVWLSMMTQSTTTTLRETRLPFYGVTPVTLGTTALRGHQSWLPVPEEPTIRTGVVPQRLPLVNNVTQGNIVTEPH